MTTKELTPAEVRRLPEGAKVTVHKTDVYGYPCRGVYYVHALEGGKKVLVSMSPYSGGAIEIRARKGWRFTGEGEQT